MYTFRRTTRSSVLAPAQTVAIQVNKKAEKKPAEAGPYCKCDGLWCEGGYEN